MSDDWLNRVHLGDAASMLAIPDKTVQMVCTSPPYFGSLRDYGVNGQIGREATVDDYVARLCAVFDECGRVLRDDGLLFVNLGDTWIEKNLVGAPWRVAFALKERGWILRDDIVWHKPNPLTSSAVDRCTPAHEYVFMLAKQRTYYADLDAVRTPVTQSTIERISQPNWITGEQAGSMRANEGLRRGGRPMRAVVRDANAHNAKYGVYVPKGAGNGDRNDRGAGRFASSPLGANLRNVWTIATAAYRGGHFAVWPAALVKRCILIGSRPGDVVLDPFMGSGTTAMVAEQLCRRWVGYEINPEYHALIATRTRQAGLFSA